jgi:hypothetical protein
MDPITLVVTAVAAGAAAALKETSSAAIKDAYAAVTALIRRHFGANPEKQAIVDSDATGSEEWRGQLSEELRSTGAESDEELIAAARNLLSLVDPQGTSQGKYVVTVSGGKGVVVGDNAHVEQTFNESD